MTGTPLKLKFGTDFAQAKSDLTGLASHAGKELLAISVAAAETSKALRVGVGSASVDVAKQLAGMSATAANANTALKVLGEAGRWAFMVQHPALYLVNQLLGDYKYALYAAGAAVAAFGAAVHVANEAVTQIKQVAAGSQAAGVGSTFFQVWRNQAVELKTDVKTLEQALANAKDAARDRVDSEGRAQVNPIQNYLEAMRKNEAVAFSTPGNFEFAKGAEEKIKAVIAAIKELIDKGHEVEALQLGEMMFGAGGAEKIVAGIRSGKLEMDALTAAAIGAGAIFDEELVKRADELDANLAKAHATIEQSLKPVLNDIGGLALSVGEGFAAWLGVLAKVSETLSKAYEFVKKINDALPTGHALLSSIPVVGPSLNFARTAAGLAMSHGAAPGAKPADAPPAENTLPDIDVFAGAPGPVARPKDLGKHSASGRAARSAGGGAETDQVETYLNSLQKSVQVLQAESEALGKSNEEKTKAVDLAKAEAAARERGTPLTAEERTQVEQLATKQAALNKQIDDYKIKQEEANSRAQFFGNTLEGAIDGMITKGSSLNQVMQSIVQSLESAALKAVLLGQGPLAGIFGAAAQNGSVGGLFGSIWSAVPKFADGGAVPGATGSAVPVLAHAGEVILNRAQQANVAGALSGGGGAVTVNHQIINNAPGVEVETKATRQANGSVQMQTMLHQALARDLASNGPTARMIQNTYGLSRASGRF